jgi:activating signal cointegrator complex subunit 2
MQDTRYYLNVKRCNFLLVFLERKCCDIRTEISINYFDAHHTNFGHTCYSIHHSNLFYQAIYGKWLQGFSYCILRFAPRPCDPQEIGLIQDDAEIDQIEGKLESMLSRRVFFIFWRIVLENKINKKSTRFDLGEIIYQRWLLDVPSILDLSVLYGYGNSRLTRELLARIFVMQSAYFGDLMQSVSYIANAFSVEGKQEDRIKYLYDVTFSLRSFLDLFPMAAFAFVQPLEQHGQMPLVQILAKFYENDLKKLDSDFQIDQIRLNILAICDAILNECYLNNPLTPLLAKKSQNSQVLLQDALYRKYLQPYLNSTIDTEQRDDIEQLKQQSSKICELVTKQMDFLENVILDHDQLSKFLRTTFESDDGLFLAHFDRVYNLTHTLRQLVKQQPQDTNKTLNEFIDTLTQLQIKYKFANQDQLNDEIDEKVLKLQEVFPTFGTGFLQLVLEYFDWDSERSVGALLENNIPESLEKVDSSTTLQQLEHDRNSLVKKKSSTREPPQSPLSSGEVSPMVWENADFFASMHIGKKNKNKEILSEMLDDGLRQRIVETYMYDDEYDDSYDDVANFDVGEGNTEEDGIPDKMGVVKQQLPSSNLNRNKPKSSQKTNEPPKETRQKQPKPQPQPVEQQEPQQEAPVVEERPQSGGRGRGYKRDPQQQSAEAVGRGRGEGGRGRGYGQNKSHKKRGKGEGKREMQKLFSNQNQ